MAWIYLFVVEFLQFGKVKANCVEIVKRTIGVDSEQDSVHFTAVRHKYNAPGKSAHQILEVLD